MNVLPVFVHSNGNDPVLLGSAVQLTSSLVLTCAHVTGLAKSESGDPPARPIYVGWDRVPVRTVHRDPSCHADLAVLRVEGLKTPPPVRFSAQWQLSNVRAVGYPEGSDALWTDGSIVLPPRWAGRDHPELVRFHFGSPNGFSGGPLIGAFGAEEFCVGLSMLGGVGSAAGVMIPAASCVAMIDRCEPGACSLTDLSPRALDDFLTAEQHGLSAPGRVAMLDRAVILDERGFRDLEAPMQLIRNVNWAAHKALAAGRLPLRVAIPLVAPHFWTFLRRQSVADPVVGLVRYLETLRPDLPIGSAIERCMDAAAAMFVVFDYEPLGADSPNPALVTIRRHIAARWSARHQVQP